MGVAQQAGSFSPCQSGSNLSPQQFMFLTNVKQTMCSMLLPRFSATFFWLSSYASLLALPGQLQKGQLNGQWAMSA